MSEITLCRMRITFRKESPIKYISHLDLLRTWERILRRAAVPLAYSQGFNPHPKIIIAMPLAVGCTGEREVVDVVLEEPLPEADLLASLEPALPLGLSVVSAAQVPLRAPALPSLISRAIYEITLPDVSMKEVEQRVSALLARESAEIEFRRKRFDFRPLIGSLAPRKHGDAVVIVASLLRDERGRIGRPDVLLVALGLDTCVREIHRKQIVFTVPEMDVQQEIH